VCCAEQPNEHWQADITHWQLADGTEVSMLNFIDDHSRLCLGSDARRNTTGPDVVASFCTAFARWGIPAGVLTDSIERSSPPNNAARAGSPSRSNSASSA
jgi:hypothetical protein